VINFRMLTSKASMLGCSRYLVLCLLVVRYTYGTFVFESELNAPDGVGSEEFGQAVALHGSLVVMTENRKAHLYQRFSKRWRLIQTFEPPVDDSIADDAYGFSVAFDGTTIAVGAYSGGVDEGGLVYLYEKGGMFRRWQLIQTLQAVTPDADDEFGYRVALHDGTLAVGARFDNALASNSGSVQVFRRNKRFFVEWVPDVSLITASDGAVDDWFGYSVALYRDLLVVGAKNDDDTAASSGSAYVFRRQRSGEWLEQQKLTASDPGAVDRFGESVVIGDRGDLVVVGAFGDDGDNDSEGSLYVFTTSADDSSFEEVAKVIAAVPRRGAQLGRSVRVQGDVIVSGAWKDTIDSADDTGSVLVFISNNNDYSSWTETDKLKVNGTAGGDDLFGEAVAYGWDGTLVVSARGRSGSKGATYIFKDDESIGFFELWRYRHD
jgi:hypothetical protein